MSWFERVSTTIKAEGHGVMDAVEDKALLLRQYVREAELELNRKRAQMSALEAEKKDLQRETRRLQARGAELEQDIQLALTHDKQDLAKHAIRQKLPLERRQVQIAERVRVIDEERVALEKVVTEQEATFETLRARAQQYAEHGSDAAVRPIVVTDADVELELLRRQAKEGGERHEP